MCVCVLCVYVYVSIDCMCPVVSWYLRKVRGSEGFLEKDGRVMTKSTRLNEMFSQRQPCLNKTSVYRDVLHTVSVCIIVLEYFLFDDFNYLLIPI